MISIIIPCYNGYKDMERCLANFERQTSKEFELIVVDDASTDDTLLKLEQYKNRSDINIKIIHNDKNVGPGASRRIALEYCIGEYVGFCDCDDWVDTAFVEELEDVMYKNEVDFCMFNNYRINGEHQSIDRVTEKLVGCINRKEIIANAPMSLCRTISKRELLNSVEFYDLYYGEDGIVLIQLLMNAKKIKFIDKPYYYYLMRNNSAHAKPQKRCLDDARRGFSCLEKIMLKEYQEELVYIGIKNLIYGGTLQGFKAGVDWHYIKNCTKEFKCKYPQYYKNKYFSELNYVKRSYVLCMYCNFLLGCKIMSMLHNYIMGR